MPIGNANIHIQINMSEFINKIVSFLFCEFNRVTSWNEGKNIILVRSSFQMPKEKYWFHFQGQRMSMQTCLFVIVILKEPLVLMCLASHFDIIESWKWKLDIASTIMRKVLNYSSCVEFRILKDKWNIYEAYILTISLVEICCLETTSFFLCARLRVHVFEFNQCRCKHVFC